MSRGCLLWFGGYFKGLGWFLRLRRVVGKEGGWYDCYLEGFGGWLCGWVLGLGFGGARVWNVGGGDLSILMVSGACW